MPACSGAFPRPRHARAEHGALLSATPLSGVHRLPDKRRAGQARRPAAMVEEGGRSEPRSISQSAASLCQPISARCPDHPARRAECAAALEGTGLDVRPGLPAAPARPVAGSGHGPGSADSAVPICLLCPRACCSPFPVLVCVSARKTIRTAGLFPRCTDGRGWRWRCLGCPFTGGGVVGSIIGGSFVGGSPGGGRSGCSRR